CLFAPLVQLRHRRIRLRVHESLTRLRVDPLHAVAHTRPAIGHFRPAIHALERLADCRLYESEGMLVVEHPLAYLPEVRHQLLAYDRERVTAHTVGKVVSDVVQGHNENLRVANLRQWPGGIAEPGVLVLVGLFTDRRPHQAEKGAD